VAANPEAIAWYLKRSEHLLDDHRQRVDALRGRGAQLAGFSGAVLALAGTNADMTLRALHGVGRGCAGVSLLIGSLLLIAASVTALRGALLPRLVSDLSTKELANYVTDRFVEEPEVWRVHLRSIRGILETVESTTHLGDSAAQAVRRAERFFFAGLSSVGVALAILVATEAF
jgi:hypothetical protein